MQKELIKLRCEISQLIRKKDILVVKFHINENSHRQESGSEGDNH